MRDVIDAMPIVQLARGLRARLGERVPSAPAVALCAIVLIYAGVSLATPHSRRLQTQLLAAHHMRPESWPSWVALQLAPKMYGFAHRVWIGPFPLLHRAPRERAEREFVQRHFWVNHYPARRARFDGHRRELFGHGGGPRYLYIRSSYRGLQRTVGYQVRPDGGRLVIDPLPPLPPGPTPREVPP